MHFSVHFTDASFYAHRTCLDYLINEKPGRETQPRSIIAFLDHGVSISPRDRPQRAQSLFIQYPDAFDCPDTVKAIFLRSENDFGDAIKQYKAELDKDVFGYSLYQMATLLKWTRGCEILLANDVKIRWGKSAPYSLLKASIKSSDITMLKFWFNLGPELDDEEQNLVGYPEDILCDAYKQWDADSMAGMVEVISELAQRRRNLQNIAEDKGIWSDYTRNSDGLVNARARELYDDLVDRGVQVQPYLRPIDRNVYAHINVVKWAIFDALYTAGFKDIDLVDMNPPSHGESFVSPFLTHVTTKGDKYGSDGLLKLKQWFLAHGANLQVQWPFSRATTLHCLSYKLGESIYGRRNMGPYNELSEALSTVLEKDCDGCECGCSIRGCLPVTTFCKGISFRGRWDPEPEEALDEALGLVLFWDDTAGKLRSPENRWFVSAWIRFMTFEKLGIRHTCCDLDRIQHEQNENPNIHVSPTRRSLEETNNIKEEDAFLLELLEKLVRRFENRLDDAWEDWGELVYGNWKVVMKRVLGTLEKIDRKDFAEGRKQLGVYIEEKEEDTESEGNYESDNEDEDEDGDDDEEVEEEEVEEIVHNRINSDTLR